MSIFYELLTEWFIFMSTASTAVVASFFGARTTALEAVHGISLQGRNAFITDGACGLEAGNRARGQRAGWILAGRQQTGAARKVDQPRLGLIAAHHG